MEGVLLSFVSTLPCSMRRNEINEWNQIAQSVSFPKANSTVEYKRGPYHSNLPTWRVPFKFIGGVRRGRGETNTIEKLAELRDSVSCLWTAVSAEEWKCFPLFGVKRTCSVGLPIIVPKASKLDFQHHFSQKSTLFPLSPWLPALKKKEREKVPVCDEQRSGFSVGIFVKNWHPSPGNVTVSWSTFYRHVRSRSGMCTACVIH